MARVGRERVQEVGEGDGAQMCNLCMVPPGSLWVKKERGVPLPPGLSLVPWGLARVWPLHGCVRRTVALPGPWWGRG